MFAFRRLARTGGWCFAPSRRSSDFSEARKLLAAYPGGSVDLEKDEQRGMAKILLNNPGKKNAFSGTMMLELAERVSELESWDAGRAVLVLGADATFCSGGDLDMMREFVKVPVGGALMSAFMHDTLLRLRRLPMVSAAFLCGRALGAGAEVATACDIRLATERVSIGFIQKKLGLTCGWGSGVRLVQMLGRTLTIELLVRGKVFGWKEAVDIGFVNGVIPEGDDSLEKAVEWLEKWTTGDVRVVRANKHLVSQIADDDMESALSRECKVFDSVWGGDAHRAALQTDAKHK